MRSSKKYFPAEIKSKIWEQLINTLKKKKTNDGIIKALKGILTDDEMNTVEKRLYIKYLLGQGVSYHEIGRIVDVNRITVRFVKRGFKKESKIIKNEKAREETYGEAFEKLFSLKKGDGDFPRYRYIKKPKR